MHFSSEEFISDLKHFLADGGDDDVLAVLDVCDLSVSDLEMVTELTLTIAIHIGCPRLAYEILSDETHLVRQTLDRALAAICGTFYSIRYFDITFERLAISDDQRQNLRRVLSSTRPAGSDTHELLREPLERSVSVNPHNKYGFQWKQLLAGSWEVEQNIPGVDYTGLVVNLVNALGFALERCGISPLQVNTSPFPDFSYVVAQTDDGVVVLLGQAPTHSLRYAYQYDLRRPGEVVTVERGLTQLQAEIPWRDFLSATFTADVLSLSLRESQRDALVEAEAERMARSVEVRVTSNPTQSHVHPISLFPSEPFIQKEKLCFVLMSFAPQLQEVFDYGIKPAVEMAGLECRRADDIMRSGAVISQVYSSLAEARIVIADLTPDQRGVNGNVYYELGLAHMMGHEAILLVQDINTVPFDLRHQRLITYNQTAAGLDQMKQTLALTIRSSFDV